MRQRMRISWTVPFSWAVRGVVHRGSIGRALQRKPSSAGRESRKRDASKRKPTHSRSLRRISPSVTTVAEQSAAAPPPATPVSSQFNMLSRGHAAHRHDSMQGHARQSHHGTHPCGTPPGLPNVVRGRPLPVSAPALRPTIRCSSDWRGQTLRGVRTVRSTTGTHSHQSPHLLLRERRTEPENASPVVCSSSSPCSSNVSASVCVGPGLLLVERFGPARWRREASAS